MYYDTWGCLHIPPVIQYQSMGRPIRVHLCRQSGKKTKIPSPLPKARTCAAFACGGSICAREIAVYLVHSITKHQQRPGVVMERMRPTKKKYKRRKRCYIYMYPVRPTPLRLEHNPAYPTDPQQVCARGRVRDSSTLGPDPPRGTHKCLRE